MKTIDKKESGRCGKNTKSLQLCNGQIVGHKWA